MAEVRTQNRGEIPIHFFLVLYYPQQFKTKKRKHRTEIPATRQPEIKAMFTAIASSSFTVQLNERKLCIGNDPFAVGPHLFACRRKRSSSFFKLFPGKVSLTTQALLTNPDDFQVGRFVGSYGFMNITSYSSFQSGSLPSVGRLDELTLGYSSEDVERLRVQDVGEGKVKIRLYEGRVAQGPAKGTRVMFKVYPGRRAGGIEADMMATNELNAHTSLQDDPKYSSQNIQVLLGGFETNTGEQWLAFRDVGKYSATDYAKAASESMSRLVDGLSWNPFDKQQALSRRRFFVVKLLNGAINGLAYMHDHDRLHQSLGPASVVLNTIAEREAAYLVPRLRDFAFSVDMRHSSLEAIPGFLSEGLWRRATAAGAFTHMEKRAFAFADDIYEAGLLMTYLAFVPFCEEGIIDGLSLQKLFESTFKLDLEAAREYCLADDRLIEAVRFLDLGDRAGWQLLQAMLNPDYRRRPIAEAVLNHRFITGAVL